MNSDTWPRCPEAAYFFDEMLASFRSINPDVKDMEKRFHDEAGVLLLNLIDHWRLADSDEHKRRLASCGMVEVTENGESVWRHPMARLPAVRLVKNGWYRMAVAADNVENFLCCNKLYPKTVMGSVGSEYLEAVLNLDVGQLAVVERRGTSGFTPGSITTIKERNALIDACLAVSGRTRAGTDSEARLEALQAVTEAVELVGEAMATDLFFAEERKFYTQRNAAAKRQFAWQHALGFGWANHDHHTYRSSREGFRELINIWLKLGFTLRERFYAGAEAGWGAQVLEHPVSRVVLFCDVDMTPDELSADFANEDLPEASDLKTIGLWCALHGESIGAAGMHHLECEFDFDRAVQLQREAGQEVMPPFTNYPFLKQAFTQAEIWAVEEARLKPLIEKGQITSEQAENFRLHGAPGSHLEILQRKDGFKGFDKTGVSAIIKATDARNTAGGD